MNLLSKKYGIPLAIKCDNGPENIGLEVLDLLDEYGVILLLSPPATPGYNDLTEAGIGWQKIRLMVEISAKWAEQFSAKITRGLRLKRNEEESEQCHWKTKNY